MFIVYAVLAGLIFSYLAGGRLQNLASVQLKYKALALSAFLLQIFLFSDMPGVDSLSQLILISLHILSYVILLLFVMLNLKVAGIPFMGAGILLNALVITLNCGYMPSASERVLAAGKTGVNNNIAGISSKTLLPWLGDIFHLPSGIPFTNSFSIGDILIAVGVIAYLVINMRLKQSQ